VKKKTKARTAAASSRGRTDSAKIHVRFPDLLTKQRVREKAQRAKTSVSRYLLTAAMISEPQLVAYEIAEQDKLIRTRRAVA
jgi:hypothetical protein